MTRVMFFVLKFVQAQDLLSSIAVLEDAVVRLEQETVSLHFQLSQEKNERRLAEYRLMHSSPCSISDWSNSDVMKKSVCHHIGFYLHVLKTETSLFCRFSLAFRQEICNGLSPPLSDIVLFGLPLKVFKMCLLVRSFHTLIKDALLSSQPMQYLTIHPPLGPTALVDTRSLL